VITILDCLIAFREVTRHSKDRQIHGLIVTVWILEAKCVTRHLERACLAACRKSDTQTNTLAGTSTDV